MRWLPISLVGCASAFLFPPRGRGSSPPASPTSPFVGDKDSLNAKPSSTAVLDGTPASRPRQLSEDGVPYYGLVPYIGQTTFNASLTGSTYPSFRPMTSRQLFVTRFKYFLLNLELTAN